VSWIELLYWPIRALHDEPLLAFVPAALLALMAFGCRRLPRHAAARLWTTVAAGMWAASGVYELRMQAWERTVTAPIRVDLLLIGPILYAATLGATIAWARWRVGGRDPARAGTGTDTRTDPGTDPGPGPGSEPGTGPRRRP
jgi:hypothetical protein